MKSHRTIVTTNPLLLRGTKTFIGLSIIGITTTGIGGLCLWAYRSERFPSLTYALHPLTSAGLVLIAAALLILSSEQLKKRFGAIAKGISWSITLLALTNLLSYLNSSEKAPAILHLNSNSLTIAPANCAFSSC